nr:hypothetical protein [Nocardiopsis alborubida]
MAFGVDAERTDRISRYEHIAEVRAAECGAYADDEVLNRGQPFGGLGADVQNGTEIQAPGAIGEYPAQVFAFEKLKHQVHVLTVSADVEHSGDRRMVQAGGRPALAS